MIIRYKDIKLDVQSFGPFTPLPDIQFAQEIGEYHDLSVRVIIQKYVNDCEESSVLIAHTGCYSPISEGGFIHDDQYIFFCTGTNVCKWNIISMNLEWDLKLDLASCFSIELMPDKKTILVSGECDISRIDFNGNVLWKFSGKDIFVTEGGECGAKIVDDKIFVTDWDDRLYILDFEGNCLSKKSNKFKSLIGRLP